MEFINETATVFFLVAYQILHSMGLYFTDLDKGKKV